MRIALALARRGLGNVWPNPAVGCVLIKDDVIVGRGWTQPGGRPHAETEALARAGEASVGATAYVTLEPCCHQGETPPCTDALIVGGVSRVVAATNDPDPRVSGKGIAKLRASGIQTVVGVCESDALELNAGFISRVTQAKPLVHLKIASTLDGKIATSRGESKWITGCHARRRVHAMRAEVDAVLIGIGTALIDNPKLTCRLAGMESLSPTRIVLDPRLELPMTSELVNSCNDIPTWLITGLGADTKRLSLLRGLGIEVIQTASDENGHVDLQKTLSVLAKYGVTRLLIEGGSEIASAFLRLGLVDRVSWFRAATVMGSDGISAVAGYGLSELKDIQNFEHVSVERIGNDLLETYLQPA